MCFLKLTSLILNAIQIRMKYTKLEIQLTNSKKVMNEGVRDKKATQLQNWDKREWKIGIII